MSQKSVNKQIHKKQAINIWAQASTTAEFFDLTDPIFGGLSIEPDGFFVRTVAYMSNNESNVNAVPVITGTFSGNGVNPDIFGVVSAGGSISHPNTWHQILSNANLSNVKIELFDLSVKGVLSPSTLTKSSYQVCFEFIEFVKNPISF